MKNGSGCKDMKWAKDNERLKVVRLGKGAWEVYYRCRSRNNLISLLSAAFLQTAGCCVTHFLLKLVLLLQNPCYISQKLHKQQALGHLAMAFACCKLFLYM